MAPIAHSIRHELQTVKSFRSVGVTQIVADSEFHENEIIDQVSGIRSLHRPCIDYDYYQDKYE